MSALLADDVDTALADAAGRFGRERFSLAQRNTIDASLRRFDAANWRDIAGMGWLAVATAADDGGLGLRIGSVAALARAAGFWGVNEPLTSTLAAADVLRLHASQRQRHDWLPGLLEGTVRVACAFDVRGVQVAGGRIDGACDVVPDADVADLLLVECRGQWFALQAQEAGVRRIAYPLADGRGAATLVFTRCAAEPLPGHASSHPSLLAALATAADSLGAMESAHALTLEHVKTRRQFGVPLGSHQVVAHRCVDMYLRLAESRALLAQAVHALQAGGEARAADVHAAKAFIGKEARLVAQDAVQLHGGIGITEECGASHALRRALVNEQLHGSTAWHLRRFMELGGSR